MKGRTAIAVTEDLLEKHVGRYEITPAFHIVVTREGNRLFAQATGQPRFEIFPESQTKFFYKVVDAQLTFDGDSLTLHQNGANMPGKKLAADAPGPKERTAITLGEDVLQRYVGRYQLAPTFIITITREDTRLFLQATGQPRLEIFAESERKFFLKVVDAQVTFEDGRLILHQNGMDQPAKKIE